MMVNQSSEPMEKNYTSRLALTYLCNAFPFVTREPKAIETLVEWIEEYTDWSLGTRLMFDRDSDQVSRQACNELIDMLRSKCSGLNKVRPDLTARRLRQLGKYMRLALSDMALVELLLRYRTDPLIESLIDLLFDRPFRRKTRGRFASVRNPVLPQILGISSGKFHRQLAPESPLMRSGLVRIDSDGDLEALGRLTRLSYTPYQTHEDVSALLFDAAPKADLEWNDFDHVAQSRDHVERLIQGALNSREAGVNILVYGPHGTGKTQFCRSLAQRLGVAMFAIGEADEDGNPPSARERFYDLRLAQRVLGDCAKAVLLFDEMDDLLSELSDKWGPHMDFIRSRRMSQVTKVGIHRILETIRVPILWTTNSVRDVSPAILRRMMFAFELRQPSPKVRTRIWARQLARHEVDASIDDAQALAKNYDVTPGVAEGATAAARLIEGGDIDTVRFGVQGLSKLVYGERPPKETATKIHPGLIASDTDVSELANQLAKRGPSRVSLCLQGPPGTGKSAFVRYVADKMGLEVAQKRASDLLSMWVGGSEKNIAQAFAEARDLKQFLVFDEADSLLADRRFAHRSWEVSQVNEMLTWMEHHPLPFACTTNYADRLDPATLRRFDFKIALHYLSSAQTSAAFQSFFSLQPPAKISAIDELTPGDFALVRRKAEVLGKLDDADALVAMLREECEAKPARSLPIGFSAQVGDQLRAVV